MSSVLHHAKLKLWEQAKCQAVYASRLIPSMICAGYEHGEMDACKVSSCCCCLICAGYEDGEMDACKVSCCC